MIEVTSPNEADLSALDLAPDTMFTYHGNISVNGAIIQIPGLPPNNYHRISVFGGQHDVHTIFGEYIQLRTDLKRTGSFPGYFNSGYARDDGRNKANWYTDGLAIQDIQPGKIRFQDRFTIGRVYTIRVANNILLNGGVFLTAGTSFEIVCKVNFQPTILEESYADAGKITLEFSQELSQEGSISGIDYDYLEFDDNKLHIYTNESGDFRLSLSGFFDVFENPIEDLDVDVSVPASSEFASESDGTYSIHSRSRYEYEDVVLARGYKWLRQNGIK
jgi:hypothetical protein